MANLVKSFFTPILWPLPHIISAVGLKGTEPDPEFVSFPYLPVEAHFGAMGAAMRSFLIGIFFVYGLYNGYEYPAFGAASTLTFSWMWPIIVRNLVFTWLVCCFWDWWLYFGPLKERLHRYKIVPKYPSFGQMKHDLFWTTVSSVIAGILEIIMCHCWATGVFPMSRSLWDKPILHLVLGLTITHWRVPHFYLVHRGMHPWKTDYIPDFGKVLYKYVHSLHHKSYNITSFSGTNMHPIESSVYYSAALLIIPLGLHPALAIGTIIDLAMGAWIGHDGYIYPGSGDVFHTLHHVHFDCNYGASHVPIDYLVGSFISKKEDLAKIWGRKPFGREGNDTDVHDDSPSVDKVE